MSASGAHLPANSCTFPALCDADAHASRTDSARLHVSASICKDVLDPAAKSPVEHALDAASRGWPVFPVGTYRGNHKAALSRKSAANPMNWGAVSDPALVRPLFSKAWGKVTGYGIVTGEMAGVFVVDLDLGADGSPLGENNLAELAARRGELPATVRARSHSGGLHLYFRHVKGIRNSAKLIAEGVDVRGEGGMTVGHGSRGAKGLYRWEVSPEEHAIAEAPAWLVFLAMWPLPKDREAIAAIGIHSHADLAGIPVDGWFDHVAALTAAAEADAKSKAAALRAQRGQRAADKMAGISVAERGNSEAVAWRALGYICDDVASWPSGGRNTRLLSAAIRVGHLLWHPATRGAFSEGTAMDSLLKASAGHSANEAHRRGTIANGFRYGLSDVSGPGSRWLEKRLNPALAVEPLPEGTTAPAGEFLSVDAARQRLDGVFADFMATAARWHADPDKASFGNMERAYGPAWAVRVTTGVGKSAGIVKAVAASIEEVGRSRTVGTDGVVTVFVPTVKLAGELVDRFRKAGVPADVYRGRSQDDPALPADAPEGAKMCWIPKLADAAAAAGVSVARVCEGCPFKDRCGYWRQGRESSPWVWVAASSVLAMEGGLDALPTKPFAVIVDEAFAGAMVTPARRKGAARADGLSLTAAELVQSRPFIVRGKGDDAQADSYASERLRGYRASLANAVAACAGGYLTRKALHAVGLGAEWVAEAIRLERRVHERDTMPAAGVGVDPDDFAARLRQAVDKPRERMAAWEAVAALLADPDDLAEIADSLREDGDDARDIGGGHHEPKEYSTRLWCAPDGALLICEVRRIASRWQDVPLLLMDATLPPHDVLRHHIGLGARVVADLAVAAPHCTRLTVAGAPVSKHDLRSERTRREIARGIRADMLANGARAEKTLVVVNEEFDTDAKRRTKGKLFPELLPGVSVAHFNALAGLDSFGDFDAVYVVGGASPPPEVVEAMAETLTGQVDEAKGYQRAVGVVRTRAGLSLGIGVQEHPNALCEALRWQIFEAGIVQAEGRMRAVNRTAADPCRIVILADVALPGLEIDDVPSWRAEFPHGVADVFAAAGVIPEGRVGAFRLFPALFDSEEEAHNAFRDEADLKNPQCGATPIKDTHKGLPHNADSLSEVRPAGSHDGNAWFRVAVDRSKMAAGETVPAFIKRRCGVEVEERGTRPAELSALLDRPGLVPLSAAALVEIGAYASLGAANRALADVTPEPGEIVVEYRRPGAKRWSRALVRATTAEEASATIRAVWPDAEVR